MNTNELFHLLALSQVDGVGDIVAKKLISHCGSAENVFKSKLKALKAIDGVGEMLVKNLKDKSVFEKPKKNCTTSKTKSVRSCIFKMRIIPKG